jgi:hypothetical protein
LGTVKQKVYRSEMRNVYNILMRNPEGKKTAWATYA